jgi:C1A family cysteine protease
MDLRILIIFVSFATTLAFEKLSKDDEDRIVESYFKNYPNVRIPRSRRARENILRHFYEVQDHNKKFRNGQELYEMELNEFSVQSNENLARSKLGFDEPVMSNFLAQNDTFDVPRTDLPDYWNWAEHGIVQPVQDQKGCGSCYAFAAIGVIESSMCRFHGNCVKLSEQEAMECTHGCSGG